MQFKLLCLIIGGTSAIGLLLLINNHIHTIIKIISIILTITVISICCNKYMCKKDTLQYKYLIQSIVKQNKTSSIEEIRDTLCSALSPMHCMAIRVYQKDAQIKVKLYEEFNNKEEEVLVNIDE